MSSKRQAGLQLTKDNYEQGEDQDDRDGPIDLAKVASSEVLAKRKIAMPRKRLPPSNSSTSVFNKSENNSTLPAPKSNPFSVLSIPIASSSKKSETTNQNTSLNIKGTEKEINFNEKINDNQNINEDKEYIKYLKIRSLNDSFVSAIKSSVASNKLADLTTISSTYIDYYKKILLESSSINSSSPLNLTTSQTNKNETKDKSSMENHISFNNSVPFSFTNNKPNKSSNFDNKSSLGNSSSLDGNVDNPTTNLFKFAKTDTRTEQKPSKIPTFNFLATSNLSTKKNEIENNQTKSHSNNIFNNSVSQNDTFDKKLVTSKDADTTSGDTKNSLSSVTKEKNNEASSNSQGFVFTKTKEDSPFTFSSKKSDKQDNTLNGPKFEFKASTTSSNSNLPFKFSASTGFSSSSDSADKSKVTESNKSESVQKDETKVTQTNETKSDKDHKMDSNAENLNEKEKINDVVPSSIAFSKPISKDHTWSPEKGISFGATSKIPSSFKFTSSTDANSSSTLNSSSNKNSSSKLFGSSSFSSETKPGSFLNKPNSDFSFLSTPKKSSPFSSTDNGSDTKKSPSNQINTSFQFGSATTPKPTVGFGFGTPPSTSKSSDLFGTATAKGPDSSNLSNPFAASANKLIGSTKPFSFSSTNASSNPFGSNNTDTLKSSGNLEKQDNEENKEENSNPSGDQAEDNSDNKDLSVVKGPGEENEDTVYEKKTKVFILDDKKPKDADPYRVVGLGHMRVLVNKAGKKTRILVRAEGSGRVVLNVLLRSAVKYQLVGKNNVRVMDFTTDGKGITYLLRVKTNQDAIDLAKTLEKNKSL